MMLIYVDKGPPDKLNSNVICYLPRPEMGMNTPGVGVTKSLLVEISAREIFGLKK